MNEQQNVALASYTSLQVGGPAERMQVVKSTSDALSLFDTGQHPDWLLGYGTNSLISDRGLPGLTWLLHGGTIEQTDNIIVADAGCWWDDLVKSAVDAGLWGIETTSGIPGSVGAAVVGNIAAYGQAVADTLVWADLYDSNEKNLQRIAARDLAPGYRYSNLQQPERSHLIVLRAAFELAPSALKPISYQTLVDTAREHHIDLESTSGRREATLLTRAGAESLYDFREPQAYAHTAGSFFRNPEVDTKTAEYVMSFDETGQSLERLKAANRVHGGSATRVSAAHVLLAAGFYRGQTWGAVRLDKRHVLKIENAGGATAQNIYDVAMEIIRTVDEKLGIQLQPEVRFIGEFTVNS